jgi:hypothetical protein
MTDIHLRTAVSAPPVNFTFPRRNDTIKEQAEVAQLVEQLIRNQQVIGSSPIFGSSFISTQKTKPIAQWLHSPRSHFRLVACGFAPSGSQMPLHLNPRRDGKLPRTTSVASGPRARDGAHIHCGVRLAQSSFPSKCAGWITRPANPARLPPPPLRFQSKPAERP